LAGSRERARTAVPITHYGIILTKEQPAAAARLVAKDSSARGLADASLVGKTRSPGRAPTARPKRSSLRRPPAHECSHGASTMRPVGSRLQQQSGARDRSGDEAVVIWRRGVCARRDPALQRCERDHSPAVRRAAHPPNQARRQGGPASAPEPKQSRTRVLRTRWGVAVTSEYRVGTIRPTILFNPARSDVLTAKVVAGALAGIAFEVLGEPNRLGGRIRDPRRASHDRRAQQRRHSAAHPRRARRRGPVGRVASTGATQVGRVVEGSG